jgi:hypothetical protein
MTGSLKRRWLWLLLVGGLIVLAGTKILRPGRTDRITEANCTSIQKGMTEEEVEAILGGPPGSYEAWPRTRPPFDPSDPPYTRAGLLLPDRSIWRSWIGEHGVAWIFFDPSGRVEKASFVEIPPERKGPSARLREWVQYLLERLK